MYQHAIRKHQIEGTVGEGKIGCVPFVDVSGGKPRVLSEDVNRVRIGFDGAKLDIWQKRPKAYQIGADVGTDLQHRREILYCGGRKNTLEDAPGLKSILLPRWIALGVCVAEVVDDPCVEGTVLIILARHPSE